MGLMAAFLLKTAKIANFATPSLPGICYEFHGEHDHEDEDDLVADLGVRLRRAQSSRSVEHYTTPCPPRLCGESRPP
jgi:hypothetical protein